MGILFNGRTSLKQSGMNMDAGTGTSPNAVVYNRCLYMFYVGVNSDGIYYTSTLDGVNWTKPRSQTPDTGVIRSNTSVSAVVFDSKLFLFYVKTGENIISYKTASSHSAGNLDWDNNSISLGASVNVSLAPSTSPNAINFKDALFVFYINDGNKIEYTTSVSGLSGSWSGSKPVLDNGSTVVATRVNTSPNAVVYGGKIRLFFSVSDNTRFSDGDEHSWGPVVRLSNLIGSMGQLDNSSPSACVSQNDKQMYLFWNSGTLSVTNYDPLARGEGWMEREDMAQNMPGGQGVMASTSPWVVEFNDRLYVFWNGANQDAEICYTTPNRA